MALKTSQMHVKDWESLRANWPKKKEEKKAELIKKLKEDVTKILLKHNILKEKNNGKEK